MFGAVTINTETRVLPSREHTRAPLSEPYARQAVDELFVLLCETALLGGSSPAGRVECRPMRVKESIPSETCGERVAAQIVDDTPS